MEEYDKENLRSKLFLVRKGIEKYRLERDSHNHSCEDNKEIRIRSFGNGKHYVFQCKLCGLQLGQSLKRDAALQLNNNIEPCDFDNSISEKLNNLNNDSHEILRALVKEEFDLISLLEGKVTIEYESKDSKERRKLAEVNDELKAFLEKYDFIFCQEKITNILISQTIHRKKEEYKEIVDSKKRFTSENELVDWLFCNFKDDFDIYPEVWGNHLAENITVRIDFIFYPKPHLISEGFIEEPFGVEVKYFKQEKGFTHKASRGIWQTISYNDCLFKIKERTFKTKFCLLFSNLSFPFEIDLLKNFGSLSENDRAQWVAMTHVANHARVGTLSINGDRDNIKGWAIKFAGGVYFYKSIYNNETKNILSNPATIEKTRIGNF